MPEETVPHLLLEDKTNRWVQRKINFLLGPQIEPLLTTIKRRKLAWFRQTASQKPSFMAPRGVFEFLKVKKDARTLREALGFQLQLDGCQHEVIIAANVGTWE